MQGVIEPTPHKFRDMLSVPAIDFLRVAVLL